MTKLSVITISVFVTATLLILAIPLKVAVAAYRYPPAPIDKILESNIHSVDKAQKYKESIVHSYTLYPKQLKQLLQDEYQKVNSETLRMQNIKASWPQMPYAYRLVNYQLMKQISTEITQSRRRYLARKKRFEDLIRNTPSRDFIYVIEATNPFFLFRALTATSKQQKSSVLKLSHSIHGIYYLSLFDNNYKHIFTYHRQHINMIKNKHFTVPKTNNERVNRSYQKIFDDYIDDLSRIGAGLDINNRNLLNQINDMKDEYRSE